MKLAARFAHAGLFLFSLTGCSAFAPDFLKSSLESARKFTIENPGSFGEYTRAGRRIRWVAAGNARAPKVIFIHGSPGGWEAFVAFLTDSTLGGAYRITADRPGYGGSEAGKTERSLAVQADALRGLLDLGDRDQPAILVGHSYGGAVVAQMAMSLDPRIRSVVIVAGSVDPDLERTKWYQYPADWWIFRWMVPENLRVCNQEIFALKDSLAAIVPAWSSIRARMSVIQGTEDELVPPGNLDFVEHHLGRPLAHRILISGMNHFVPWRRPDTIRTVVRDELALLSVKSREKQKERN